MRLLDDVFLRLSAFIQEDDISRLDILEDTKESVPVTSDPQIPGLTYAGRAFNASHSPVQGDFVRAIENWGFQI